MIIFGMLKPGTQAPNFSLPDQNGTIHTLAQLKGKWALVYFYPKDDTPGCTVEACALRDHYATLQKAGVVVFGISTDSVKSHKKFAEKYTLPFTILADEQKKTVNEYGVCHRLWRGPAFLTMRFRWREGEKKFMGRTYHGTRRTSFLINPQGKIAKIYEKVKPAAHASDVLADMAQMKVK